MFKFPPKEGSMTWMGCCSIRKDKDKALSSLFFLLLLLLLLSLFLLPKPLPVLKVFYTRKRQKLLGVREKRGQGQAFPTETRSKAKMASTFFC